MASYFAIDPMELELPVPTFTNDKDLSNFNQLLNLGPMFPDSLPDYFSQNDDLTMYSEWHTTPDATESTPETNSRGTSIISSNYPSRQCRWIIAPGYICAQIFADEQSLHEHAAEAHFPSKANRPVNPPGQEAILTHQCQWDDCTKLCSSRPKLDRHVTTHTGWKRYACNHPGCSVRMTTNDQIQKHQRTHTGEKPYACDMCDKCFATGSERTTHRNTHLKTKPFKCDLCNHGCDDSSNLSKHRKTHFLPMFRCTGCPARYRTFKEVKQHVVESGHDEMLASGDAEHEKLYRKVMKREFDDAVAMRGSTL